MDEQMTSTVSLVELTEQPAIVVRDSVALDEIAQFLEPAFSRVYESMSAAGVDPSGPPFARFALQGHRAEVEAGFPYAGPDARDQAQADDVLLPGGMAAQATHIGTYDSVDEAYRRIEHWMLDHGYAPRGTPWESYLDPSAVGRARTVVTWPCRPRRGGSPIG